MSISSSRPGEKTPSLTKGKYWSYPAETQLPYDHPAYYTYGRGVERDGTVKEIGIAPRPLQQPIPLYGGFTNSLRTVMYWARVGGKPIIMSDNTELSRPIEAIVRTVSA